MNSMDDVYRGFGYAAEAAQLLETELGTYILQMDCNDVGIFGNDRPVETRAILDRINRSTLGALIKKMPLSTNEVVQMSEVLTKALDERNRLTHHFYRRHNFRQFSDAGRVIMVKDLENIHASIFAAYKAVLKIGGTDLDKIDLPNVPFSDNHLNLD